MQIIGWLTKRLIAASLVIFLAAPFGRASSLPWQESANDQQDKSAASSAGQKSGASSGNATPDADATPSAPALPNAPAAAPTKSDSPAGQNANPQPLQDGATKPVGTAAAPSEMTTGVAAAQPAGAVIAPGKQRRMRTILISVGVIVAACVALGTVAGLSRTSPSQPK